MIDNEENNKQWDAELKAKERLFVLNYCTNENTLFNAAQSYRETYTHKDKSGRLVIPEKQTCEANGSRLSKRPRVKAAIKQLLKIAQGENDEQNVYKVIHDLCLLSFFNPAEILNEKGGLKTKTLEQLGDKAKCIAQITKTRDGIKYTLVDRSKAMDKLLNYLNIIRPEQQIDIKLPVIEMVQKAIDPESWNALQEEAEKAQGE